MIKLAILTAIIGGLISAGNWYVSANSQDLREIGEINVKKANIENYDDCVAAGYPVMKSWPGQCATGDGRVFTDTKDTQPTIDDPAINDPSLSPLPKEDESASAVKSVLAKAAKELNTEAKNITITAVLPKEWPDGCLGLAEAGQMCTMMIIPGYEISLSLAGEVVTYRTNLDGTLVKRYLN